MWKEKLESSKTIYMIMTEATNHTWDLLSKGWGDGDGGGNNSATLKMQQYNADTVQIALPGDLHMDEFWNSSNAELLTSLFVRAKQKLAIGF